MGTATPIPAFAPLERPLLGEGLGVGGIREVNELGILSEAEEVEVLKLVGLRELKETEVATGD